MNNSSNSSDAFGLPKSPSIRQHLDRYAIASGNRPTRHVIVAPNGNEYDTVEGLAFTLGVAVVECETTRLLDGSFYRIQHPNGVDIYHVAYIGDTGQVIVTKVGAH